MSGASEFIDPYDQNSRILLLEQEMRDLKLIVWALVMDATKHQAAVSVERKNMSVEELERRATINVSLSHYAMNVQALRDMIDPSADDRVEVSLETPSRA